jgi:hypothetical protein
MKIQLFASILVISIFAQAQSQVSASVADSSTTSTSSVVKENSADAAASSKVVKDDPDYYSKSSFGMAFYSLGGYDDTQFNNPDPSFSMYDAYVSLSWKMPNDIRLALLPTFGYTTSGNDYQGRQATDKFYWRDFSISVAQNNLFENYIGASWNLKQKARLYLPTSDGSKEEGMIARIRLEFEARYNLDRYSSVRAYLKPSYYFQRSKSYLSGTKVKASKLIDAENGAELNWSLNKYFSVKPGFEIKEKWANYSEVNSADLKVQDRVTGEWTNFNGTHSTVIDYRFGFEIRPNRNMNFTIGIQDERDLADPSATPVTSYSLLTNITIL